MTGRTPDSAAFQRAAAAIRSARHLIAFTGAGVSVESGIPPFRGANGVWNKYDPSWLELDFFLSHPEKSWPVLKEMFYEYLAAARPNPAHLALAALEEKGLLQALITQNIDDLHRQAGNQRVLELHGNYRRLSCTGCAATYLAAETDLGELPPTCRMCGAVLKPDIVFFGEALPEPARSRAFAEAGKADVVLVVGTSGEVMPAGLIPRLASDHGATIIEVNTVPPSPSPSPTSSCRGRRAKC
jgi:NAD-dependent deacetylase